MHRLRGRLRTWLYLTIASTTFLARPAAAGDPAARRLHVFVPIPAMATRPPGGENLHLVIGTNVSNRPVISTHLVYVADQTAIPFAKDVWPPGETGFIERGGSGGSPPLVEEFGASPDVVFSSRFVARHADGTDVPYRLPVFNEHDAYSGGTTATLQLLPSLAAGSIELAIFSLAGKPASCIVGVFDEHGTNRATSTLALPPGPWLASHTVAPAAAAISYVRVSCNGRFFVFATRFDSADPEFVWPGRSDAS
ncbi:MAG: hypothetical protein JOZ15_09725 [Acidobacteria bacterium]|nr:hypothetical protein [Acidobacteriota bacterium]